MAYADAKARLLVHVQTASAAMQRPFEDIKLGLPLPKGRSIRVYYGGETGTSRMGGRYTANSEMVGKITLIAAFWPITALDEELGSVIDAEMEAFSHALRTAVDEDSDLNGQVDNTTLEYGEPDIVIVGNTRYAMLLWSAMTDYVEYAVAK